MKHSSPKTTTKTTPGLTVSLSRTKVKSRRATVGDGMETVPQWGSGAKSLVRGGKVHSVHLASTLLKDKGSTRDNHILTCNFAKYSPILNFFFTHRLSNKPILIWLLTTPPHHKYVGTLPYNLSLMACFVDINVSQGSVATQARCGGIFNTHLTANLP